MQEQSTRNNTDTVLVVDDDFVREMISDYLRDYEGYKIIEAENGSIALEILKANHIDLSHFQI